MTTNFTMPRQSAFGLEAYYSHFFLSGLVGVLVM